MSDAAPRVTVVVVTWNGRAHLERCLPALARQTYPAFDVVVVDNGSRDGTVAWLQRDWPRHQVVALDENVGFAAANNLAFAETTAEWLALLNNDAVPEPGWLAALVAAVEGQPRVASAASLMAFDAAPDVINSAGIAVDPTGIAWDRLGGRPVSAGEQATEVFGASAGAGLFRRAALLDAAERKPEAMPAVFDERFFMFMEDVDLAWRLRLRGWTSVYAPEARVRHCASASAGEGSAFKNRLLARNKIWTVLKDYPALGLLPRLPLVLAYDLASAPYRLAIQGQTAALHGRLDAVRGLAPILRQRRAVQASRRVPWSEVARSMAPLEVPWAVPRRYRHLRSNGACGPDGRR